MTPAPAARSAPELAAGLQAFDPMTSPSRIGWARLLSVLALGASGCAASQAYRPAEHATGRMRGHVAAEYPIPPRAPRGEVRIASFGVARLVPQSGAAPAIDAMHVRLEVANRSGEPWTLDLADQLAVVRGAGEVRPALARSDAGDLPWVSIAPGGRRTIDLFFPLPASARKPSRLPELDVIWQVRAGAQIVIERTPFARLAVEPAMASAGADYYGAPYTFGPYGWRDPFRDVYRLTAPSWIP